MLTYTMSRRLAGALLQQCRMNKVQRKQRKLTIGLGVAVIILILLCTVACGGSDGSLAKGGINVVVVSGQAGIQGGGGNTLVVEEGQEAVITAGDQITAEGAGVKLLLADGSLLGLKPGTGLQVVTFSTEGTAKLNQLQGTLEVEAASELLTTEISLSVTDSFVLKTVQFTATPAERDTAFQLWIDDVNNAHLTVKAGAVNVTHDNHTERISAGEEMKAIPGEELAISQIETPVELTAVAMETANPAPTITPTLTLPSPTVTETVSATPIYLYPAPGLVGPGDGDEFKGVNETILLLWDTPTPLSADEWYEVQLWEEGEVPYTVVQRVKEGAWKVDPKYYPGSYQWRILIARGEEDHKEAELSPPSPTWSFDWLRTVVQPPPATAPTSPAVSGAVDLTVYLRDTNNEQGVAVFPVSGERINAGTIYDEGGTVYGDVAVRIGGTVYHFDQDPEPVGVEQLPDPYRMEFKFSDFLVAATEDHPWFVPQKAQFGAGKLDCNSAAPSDKPYKIEMTLYAGGEVRKHTEISFLVADAPLCGDVGGGDDGDGGGGGEKPPPRRE